ncbi:MAG: DUF1345 domain-containing protein [Dermatophilaceae bacterium]
MPPALADRDREDIESPGLKLQGPEPPVFDDYLYQAVAVSASFAASDVTPSPTTRMRRTVRAYTLVVFVCTTVILALLVSLLTAVAA